MSATLLPDGECWFNHAVSFPVIHSEVHGCEKSENSVNTYRKTPRRAWVRAVSFWEMWNSNFTEENPRILQGWRMGSRSTWSASRFIRHLRKGCMFANTGGCSLSQWISKLASLVSEVARKGDGILRYRQHFSFWGANVSYIFPRKVWPWFATQGRTKTKWKALDQVSLGVAFKSSFFVLPTL